MYLRLPFLATLALLASALPLAAQSPAPANPNLSPNARRVLTFIQQQHGQKILAGQEEAPNQLTGEQNAIIAATGKRPAIRGWDVRFQNPNAMTEAKNSWLNHRQFVTFSWHMGIPLDGPMTLADDNFDSSKTNITDPAVYDAIITPGTTRYNNLMAKLKEQADRLQVLADADVPVLWRPLHEHEADGGSSGGWFWWSDINGDVTRFTRLWSIMYNYFTHTRGLNNLIWVWSGNKNPLSSAGGTTGVQWYNPIANQVDILGTDVYGQSQNNSYWELCYDNLKVISPQKPAALTENALIPLPDDMVAGNWLFSWFLTWTGDWRRENSDSRLQHIYQHARVLTADELPDLKGSGDTTAPSAPSGLSSSNLTGTSFTLSWNGSTDTGGSGLAGYSVFLNGTEITNSLVTGTSYNVTGLAAGTTYSMRVSASDNAANESALSSALSVTTTTSGGGGGTGTNVVANAGFESGALSPWSGTQAYISGVARTGSHGGRIGSSSGAAGTIQQTVTVQPNTSYTLTAWVRLSASGSSATLGVDGYGSAATASAVTGTTWESRTISFTTGSSATSARIYLTKPANAGQLGHLDDVSLVASAPPPDTTAPTTPGNLTSPSKTSTSVSLAWSASTDNVGVTGYNVYRGTTLATTVGGSTTSATVTGLTASTSYTFTVRARDAANNLSPASNSVTVTTNAAASGTNLATNAGFETGSLSPWSGTQAYISGVARTGSHGGRIGSSTGAAGTIQQTITVQPNTSYTLTAWVRLSATGSSATLGADGYGGAVTAAPVTGTTWESRTLTFTTGSSATTVRVYLSKPANTGQLGHLDDVTLIAN